MEETEMLNGLVDSSGLMFHPESSKWETLFVVLSKDQTPSHIHSFIDIFMNCFSA